MASKPVIYGLSVSGGVALVALLVVILVLFVPRKPATHDATGCGAAPVVNPATGQVSNYKNTLLPDMRTCGENVDALTDLCLTTRCRSPACKGYQTWDAYNTMTHACEKVEAPSCQQQLCDAPYCESESVRALLPPLHKIQVTQEQCINPPEQQVAEMCNRLPGHQYVSPDCRDTSISPTITMTPLVTTTTRLTGVFSFSRPRQDGGQMDWVYTYKLVGVQGSFSGPVLTSVPSDLDKCVGDAEKCLSFTIYFPPGTVRPGTYSLQLFARPRWSAVNTAQSKESVTVKLVQRGGGDNVHAELNPAPSRASAEALLKNDAMFRQLLAPLPSQLPGACVASTLTVRDMIVLQPTPDTGAGSADVVVLACTPNVCPMDAEGEKLMAHALVVVSWPQVVPLAACGASAVSYKVTRQQSTGADVAVPVAVFDQVVGFMDLLRVGESAVYTIVAQQGTCSSDAVTLPITIPPFTDEEVCHRVFAEQQVCQPLVTSSSQVPPWLWESPSGCVWRPNMQSAKDYYCAFEYGHAGNSAQSPSADRLFFADSAGQCQQLKPAYPTLTKPYPDPTGYCDNESKASKNELCFTGFAGGEPRKATCTDSFPLGNTTDRITGLTALSNRVSELLGFYDQHHTELLNVDALKDVGNLYKTYYHCGPAENPDQWGTVLAACATEDTECKLAVSNARCGTETDDRNLCEPWAPVAGSGDEHRKTYAQQRVCYGSPTFTNTNCCQPNQTYKFDKNQPRGGARGTCTV